MKCKDCGETESPPARTAGWLCEACFELRKLTLEAVKAGTISMDEFRELQRALARGDGRAANAMRRCLGMDSPTI